MARFDETLGPFHESMVATTHLEADGGHTSDAARQLMPLGVGRRLQKLGVIWSGPTIVLSVMGEVDVYFSCNN